MKIVLMLIAAALGVVSLITYNAKKPNSDTKPAETGETIRPESSTTPKSLPTTKDKSPVLIELFTSEGCSSCPPADKNLMNLDEQQPFADAEVIALSMHVDYWNRLGWTDPFSSPQFSERQGFYSNTFKLGEVYTPQMVVDGQRQFVGSNSDEARKAVSEAVKTPKAKIELSVAADNKLRVKISDLPKHTFSNVFLAVAEDDLSIAVGRGENGGRTLRHTAVVRELKTVGAVKTEDSSFETKTEFKLQPAWKKQNLKLVVFVQIEQTSQIIGAGQIRL